MSRPAAAPPWPVLNGDPACAEFFHRCTDLQPERDEALPAPAPVCDLVVPLPGVFAAPGRSVEQAIAARRTRRDFDASATMPIDELARLLVFGCGRTALPMPGSWAPQAGHRAVPSAGASYPVTASVIVQRVAGLAPGVYAYGSEEHALRLVRAGRFEAGLRRWTLDQPWMLRAAAIFALVGRIDRIAPRYSARGYRYMLFEAGHIAQNVYLLGAANELCVQAAGGFIDAAICRLLCLSDAERALYLLAVGPCGGAIR